LVVALRLGVRRREGQPNPRQPPEAGDHLGRRLVVAKQTQRRAWRDHGRRPEQEVEPDHESVLEPHQIFEIHCGGTLIARRSPRRPTLSYPQAPCSRPPANRLSRRARGWPTRGWSSAPPATSACASTTTSS